MIADELSRLPESFGRNECIADRLLFDKKWRTAEDAGGILFYRGLLGQGWLWTLGGYCLLQAAFGLALAGKYVQFVSLRLGWEGQR